MEVSTYRDVIVRSRQQSLMSFRDDVTERRHMNDITPRNEIDV